MGISNPWRTQISGKRLRSMKAVGDHLKDFYFPIYTPTYIVVSRSRSRMKFVIALITY